MSCLIPQSPSRWFGASNTVKRHREHQTSGLHTKGSLYVLWLHIVFEITAILLSPDRAVSAATRFTFRVNIQSLGVAWLSQKSVSLYNQDSAFWWNVSSGAPWTANVIYIISQTISKCQKRGTQGILSSVHMLGTYLNIWRINTCNQDNIAAILNHYFKMFSVTNPLTAVMITYLCIRAPVFRRHTFTQDHLHTHAMERQ